MQTTRITVTLRYATKMQDAIRDSNILNSNLKQIASDTWDFEAEDMDEHENFIAILLDVSDSWGIPENEITFGGMTLEAIKEIETFSSEVDIDAETEQIEMIEEEIKSAPLPDTSTTPNTGKAILKNLENHCKETLRCSDRLRFHIEQTIQRMIDKDYQFKTSLAALLEHPDAKVYNPSFYRLSRIPGK